MSLLDSLLNKVGFERKDRLGDYFGLGTELDKITPDRFAVITRDWFFNPFFGQPRNVNVLQLRNFCKSVWARMCIDNMIDEVTQVNHSIVPIDESGDITPQVQKQIKKCEDFYANPNRNNESLLFIHKGVVRDVIEIDAGVMVKVFSKDSFEGEEEVEAKCYNTKAVKEHRQKLLNSINTPYPTEMEFEYLKTLIPKLKPFGKRTLLEIWSRDGGSFLKNVDRRGIMNGFFQYSYYRPLYHPIPFANEEIVYIIANPRTESVYGWSPMQSIMEVVESLNVSIVHNRDLLKSGAVPDAVGSLIGADKEQLKKWRKVWQKEFQGKPHKIAWHNMDMKLEKLTMTSREMEWLESQKWYARLVMAMYKVAPAELGFTDAINKATAESQERKQIRAAIKPLLRLLEYHHSTEIIPEILQEPPLVKFKFDHVDLFEEARERANDNMDLDRGVVTINEVRAERGLDPVEWGDVPMKMQQTPLGFNFGTSEDATDEFKKKLIFKASREKVETEAKTYAEYLERELNKMQTLVLEAVETELPSESNVKSYGTFLSQLFNIVFSIKFYNQIRRLIKQEFIAAMTKTENETGIQAGVTEDVEHRITQLANQQINGYTLPDGQKWHGIKGATKDIQNSVMNTVLEGMNKGEGIADIQKRVREVFDVSKSRAVNIARTESIRIANNGLLTGYIKSGVKGKKEWIAKLDDRTSAQCRRLNGQEVDLTDVFKDENGQWQQPPSHPQCRCRIVFKPE
jgi:SPP1 gp7 family putative phage head morphogenesis protein